MSANERTGWRDLKLSLRHRRWGFNCPAADLDFLMVEYDIGEPAAIIEYKDFHAVAPDVMHPTYRALVRLADGYRDHGLPCLIVFYWPDIWAFKAYPLNDIARKYFKQGESLTERQYVRRLYDLRARSFVGQTALELQDVRPPEDYEPKTRELA